MPWTPDVQVVYEHLHRYLWAAALVEGRHVLDLASGEGFGAAILAESARSVVGVDIDERSVEHSRLNYGGPSLNFCAGDAHDLSLFDDDSFDAVVAFEMIEHVEDQARVLEEVRRVLAPDGLLIMSTPDRRAYGDASDEPNPYHVHELDRAEFADLLASRFAATAMWGQRTITGSVLSALDPLLGPDAPSAQSFFVERAGDDWVEAALSPIYLVALASNADLPAVPANSTLADRGVQLVRAAEAAGVEAGKRGVEAAEREAEHHRHTVADLKRLLDRRDRVQAELRMALADQVIERELHRERARELHDESKEAETRLSSLESELAAATQFVQRVEQSVSWQLFERLRGRLFALVGGEHSRGVQSLQAILRLGGRVLRPRGQAPAPATRSSHIREPASPPTIVLPVFAEPEVSLVIPLYRRADLTRACLESIRDRTVDVSYEIILVDDDADSESKELIATVSGARVLVNTTNIGYLRSVKRGAAEARGRWLVLCNNDIQVREGWLTELLRCARSSSDIAIVTPKYLYPDLTLNEAGGVIWRDGTGGNYGRGDSPALHQYEYPREVDYGSAAALLVRADFWRDVGGFDERFMPMYYEDVDLCFQARERGMRVMYEPRAQVIHAEGATAGVDLESSHKRHQELNRPKFVEKWRARLEAEHLPSGESDPRRGANRLRSSQPHVLIADHRVPMWDRDAGSLRMRWMIETLVDLGCRVTLLPDSLHGTEPYTTQLRRMGVDVLAGEVDIAAEFQAIGPELSLVVLSRPHTTSRWLDPVREFAPAAPVVFDTVDLHWLRIARRAAIGSGTADIDLGPQARSMHELELSLVRATDVTLVVSEDDRARIEAHVPEATIRIVPTVHELRTPVPPLDQRAGVLFVGGFEHTPNVDAAIRLVEDVMPKVWEQMGEVPVTIVGGSAPQTVKDLASSLVTVAGWVEDLDPLIDSARAQVVPVTWGAGLKGKITQSLADGLPVVTTPIGAEGLDAVDGGQLMIGETDDELAERVIRVLQEDDLWQRLSSAGQALAEACCSPRRMADTLEELLDLAGRGSELAAGA